MRTVSHGDRQNRGRLRTKRTVKRVTFATIINVCVLQIETGLRCLMFVSRSTVVLHSQVSPCTEPYMARVCVVQSLRFGASRKIRKHVYVALVTRTRSTVVYDLRGLSSHGSSKSTCTLGSSTTPIL